MSPRNDIVMFKRNIITVVVADIGFLIPVKDVTDTGSLLFLSLVA